ncbi:protein ABHD18 isoform X2 [Toxorhynchites rutilus septentrionalis]|uniref:protein ABHD18 isoform X2 n=1 Tax=Toxorhynchites rutilus septentrionalis TaxID=329112 RepID=UPI0024792448|nr:protein ABHD18 isoform X2 [Toxorhynchites rutilus septentrionalis]
MPPSRLDGLYRSLLLTKFFCKGWGKPENLERLFEFRKIISNRAACSKLVPNDYPVEITKEEVTSDCKILEGKFKTPLEIYLPGLVPDVVQNAHFQMLLPLKWNDERFKPMCIHLAGTGDHYYWKRRNLIAKPLLKEANLGAIILENPFYGMRKPKDQRASSLHNVSDIFVMGGCLVLESLVLLNWCERNGYGPLGITGLSMGGHMASLAATNWPKPLVLVPCLSWSTASAVFTEGVMSHSINWDVLETQYFADGNFRERLSKMELKQDISETTELICENARSGVNLTVVRDTTPEREQKRIEINRRNVLNLSEPLLNKLLSNVKCELTQAEIDELNLKIQIALKNYKEENKTDDNTMILEVKAEDSPETSPSKSLGTKIMEYISWNSNGNKNSSKTGTELVPTEKREPIDITKTRWWEREALQFMRGMMDECTHLKNFSVPYDTSLIIAVCAKDDAYIPREGCTSLEDIWPGAEIRYLDAGHVSAYVLHQKLFRSCIIEAFERARKKWIPEHERVQELNLDKTD